MNNAQKLLEKIEAENITPISAWYFILKNIGFWIIGLLFVAFGGVSIAIMMDIVFETETDVLQSITHSQIEFYLSYIPFFWIFFLIIFLAFAYFGVSNTKKGYRYSPFAWLGGSIILSIILGSTIFFSGYAEKIEHTVAQHISFYYGTEEMKKQHWTHAQDGFLAGEIIEVTSDSTLLLQDWNGKQWTIFYSEDALRKQGDEKYGYKPKHYKPAKIEKGQYIKIRGESIGNKNIQQSMFMGKKIMGW